MWVSYYLEGGKLKANVYSYESLASQLMIEIKNKLDTIGFSRRLHDMNYCQSLD